MKYFYFFLMALFFSNFGIIERGESDHSKDRMKKFFSLLKDEKGKIAPSGIISAVTAAIVVKLGFCEKLFSQSAINTGRCAGIFGVIGLVSSSWFFIRNSQNFEKLIQDEDFKIDEFSKIYNLENTIIRYMENNKYELIKNTNGLKNFVSISLSHFIRNSENHKKIELYKKIKELLEEEKKISINNKFFFKNLLKTLENTINSLITNKAKKIIQLENEIELFQKLVELTNNKKESVALLEKATKFLEEKSELEENKEEKIELLKGKKVFLKQVTELTTDISKKVLFLKKVLHTSKEIFLLEDNKNTSEEKKIKLLEEKKEVLENTIEFLKRVADFKNEKLEYLKDVAKLEEEEAECLKNIAKFKNKEEKLKLLEQARHLLENATELNDNNEEEKLRLLEKTIRFLEKIADLNEGKRKEKLVIEAYNLKVKIRELKEYIYKKENLKQNEKFHKQKLEQNAEFHKQKLEQEKKIIEEKLQQEKKLFEKKE